MFHPCFADAAAPELLKSWRRDLRPVSGSQSPGRRAAEQRPGAAAGDDRRVRLARGAARLVLDAAQRPGRIRHRAQRGPQGAAPDRRDRRHDVPPRGEPRALERDAEGRRHPGAGWERTYGWPARDTEWDGRWLVLSVTVPESQRKLRHHLQSRLLWAGLGSPAPGEWLTPHAERGEQVAQIVRELGLSGQAHSFVGELGPLGDPLRLIDAAWNLDDLDKDYRSFIGAYARREPRTDREHFRAGSSSCRTGGGFPISTRTCRPPTCRHRGRRPRRRGCSPSGTAAGRRHPAVTGTRSSRPGDRPLSAGAGTS